MPVHTDHSEIQLGKQSKKGAGAISSASQMVKPTIRIRIRWVLVRTATLKEDGNPNVYRRFKSHVRRTKCPLIQKKFFASTA